jgi:hypothetical protein
VGVQAAAAIGRSRASRGALGATPSIDPWTAEFADSGADRAGGCPEINCVRSLLAADVIDAAERRAAWVLLLTPAHWLLLSLAAWRALYQLATAPYAWEKTEHGLAKSSRRAAKLVHSLLELERYLSALKETGKLPTLADDVTDRAAARRLHPRVAARD